MAVKQDVCQLKYLVSDYIKKLHKPEDEAVSAIADLIEDLHKNKIMTVNYIINLVEIELLICQFFKLLKASLPIIVGNTAFILGTLAEFEEGRSKIIHILSLEDSDKLNSLDLLISLLDTDDPETLLNVTGTIGSLVESTNGRRFILSRTKCFTNILQKVNCLLQSTDLWIGSNAALIIARVSIDEIGNSSILNNPLLDRIIINLINCLGFDNAGRGMNAAFALGRIFDNGTTIETYYSLIYKMNFIEKLVNLTSGNEMGFVKNSCFCLSSIMGSKRGFEVVIADSSFNQLIVNLDKLLFLDDDETIWFGVLTLKIISKKPPGCKLLKKSGNLLLDIKKCLSNPIISDEVKSECREIVNNLTPLERPPIPNVTLISSHEVRVSWNLPAVINEFEIKSYLYCKHGADEMLSYRGKKNDVFVKNLESNKKYEFYLKFANDIEITASSESFTITTAEDYPTEPRNVRIVTSTSTQIKIGWDEPEHTNGTIKCYNIYMKLYKSSIVKLKAKYFPYSKVVNKDKRYFEQTNERSSIISGLQPETRYNFTICAVNSCGKSNSVEIDAFTLSSGAHAPGRPNVMMLGRSEAHLTWNPPEAPMGKIFRYDVKMNPKGIVYTGIHTYCKITNLKSDTDYSFTVIVVTSEGRYESPVCRKRTAKDEYVGSFRAPLYESKPKKEVTESTNTQKVPHCSTAPTILNKQQTNALSGVNHRNSEFDPNLKLPGSKLSFNVMHLNRSSTTFSPEITKQPTTSSSQSESTKKLQPILSYQRKPRQSSTRIPSGVTYVTDIPASSLQSASLTSVEMPSYSSKKMKESSGNSVRCPESTDKSFTGLKIVVDENFSTKEKSLKSERSQIRQLSLKFNNDLSKVPVKNMFSKSKRQSIQRRPSNYSNKL